MGIATQVSTESRGTARARDGYPLTVTRYTAAGKPWASLVMASAMGVRQEFYAPLARHFADNGIHVLTFDYRGTFASRPERMRGFPATVLTWANEDLDAMLVEADAMASSLPLAYLGHSLGGQILGVPPNNHRVRAALTVTAGSGWYRHNDRMPFQVRLFWFGAIPALTPLFGYFPGKATRMVGDLPEGVAWQWRRWCLDRDYLHSEGAVMETSFDRVRAPIRSYSFEDDSIITRAAVDDLHGRYRQAKVERRHLEPADIGARRIAHFGFFSESSRDTLWRDSVDWLRSRLQTA